MSAAGITSSAIDSPNRPVPASSRNQPFWHLGARASARGLGECAGGQPDCGGCCDAPRRLPRSRPRRRRGCTSVRASRAGRSAVSDGSCLEDLHRSSLQRRAHLEAELLGKAASCLRERVERGCGVSCAVLREHQLLDRALAERLFANERLELGHELSTAAKREVGLSRCSSASSTPLLEVARRRGRKRLIEHVRQRRTAPLRQRRSKEFGSPRRSPRASARPPASARFSNRSRSSSPGSTSRDNPAGDAAAAPLPITLRNGDTSSRLCATLPGGVPPQAVDQPVARDRRVRSRRSIASSARGLARQAAAPLRRGLPRWTRRRRNSTPLAKHLFEVISRTFRATAGTLVQHVKGDTRRKSILSVALLVLLALATGAAASRTTSPFTVATSLDGKNVLPLRTRWLAYPKLPAAKIKEVDFLIDGKLRSVKAAPRTTSGATTSTGTSAT